MLVPGVIMRKNSILTDSQEAKSLQLASRARIASVVCGSIVLIGGFTLFSSFVTASPELELNPPSRWPANSQIARQTGCPTLLIFLHPKCSCNRANLDELAEVLSRLQSDVDVHAVFYCPNEQPQEWAHTDLWDQVRNLGLGAMQVDKGGLEAERFGARSSGHCFLFGTQSERLFGGGLAKGEGNSASKRGIDAVENLLRGEAVEQSDFPVVGCSLSKPSSISSYDFFTNYGNYMPRIHCLQTAEGGPDWKWITILIALNAIVLVGYLRIFLFWRRCYKNEQENDRDGKLMQLAWLFFVCAITGYGMSTVIFFWPAYRLLAIAMLLLAFATWRFTFDLQPFQKSFAAHRLQRQLNEVLREEKGVLEEHNFELEATHRALAEATEENEKLALVAKYTDNAVVITDAQVRVEWANEGFTRLTGYTLDEIRGCVPGKLLQGENTDHETIAYMSSRIKQQKGFDVEIVNYSKSGEEYWLAIEVRPIHDSHGNVVKFIAIESNITERKQAEQERVRLSSELQEAARKTGMADVATGVLHNVGNVLNSVNVSANLLMQQLQGSKVTTLRKASDLIYEKRSVLSDFLIKDERGKHFPQFLKELTTSLSNERDSEIEELRNLLDNIEHVKEIVNMQQTYARISGATEPVDVVDMVEDAMRINDAGLIRHSVEVVRELEDAPLIMAEKHKVLQILVNLISNAKYALSDSNRDDKIMTLSVTSDEQSVCIQVHDNGVGIAPEHLSKIFNHGFTTKQDGHGFGLHSSALAAQELGGALTAQSSGIGKGATFALRLPIERETLCKV